MVNTFLQAGEEWKADECTSCTCRGGKAVCDVEQCSTLDCPADEIPSLSPGSCCPVCLASKYMDWYFSKL